MLPAIIFVLFVLLVVLLARRFGDSPNAPRGCCSARSWPPTDLTGEGGGEQRG